jgi:hypothetical protein
VQKWLGHAQLTTTAICADAVGARKRISPVGCGGEAVRDTGGLVPFGYRREGDRFVEEPAQQRAIWRMRSSSR